MHVVDGGGEDALGALRGRRGGVVTPGTLEDWSTTISLTQQYDRVVLAPAICTEITQGFQGVLKRFRSVCVCSHIMEWPFVLYRPYDRPNIDHLGLENAVHLDFRNELDQRPLIPFEGAGRRWATPLNDARTTSQSPTGASSRGLYQVMNSSTTTRPLDAGWRTWSKGQSMTVIL